MPIFEIKTYKEKPIEPQAVQGLYASVGWWPDRREKEIELVLKNHLAVGAWDDENLVGFARAISDGSLRAYIEDVVVHPQYQQMGVGTMVMAKLLEELENIETITLFCQPELADFYEKMGFQAFAQQIMHRKRSV